MSRIIRSRRFALSALLCALAGLGWFTTVWSPRAPADDPVDIQANCVGCTNEKTFIRLTDDPDVNVANWKAAHAVAESQMRASVEVVVEAARKERLKKMNTWQGTIVSVTSDVTDEHHAIARIFGDNPPAPEARKREFAYYFNGQSEYKCVGWCAVVSSVTRNDDGWLLTVRVGPHLMREQGGVVFTPRECVETWQVSKAGKLEFVNAKCVGFSGVMVD